VLKPRQRKRQQAIVHMNGMSCAGGVRRLHAEHREAANTLRRHVRASGGTPDRSSGVWDSWRKAVDGNASHFDTRAPLNALNQGEEQAVKDYEAALNEAGLTAECPC
jgi:hypothetical protein